MIKLSVIVPSRNRVEVLHDALQSVLGQTMSKSDYEIIVVDNGSTDTTPDVVKNLQAVNGEIIRYFYDDCPGLHIGRHLGAAKARGEILVYADDDIVASPGWLNAIGDAFTDESVSLVGGKILPAWEGDVPGWTRRFMRRNVYGSWLGYLSLLDFGDSKREIDPSFVFGCNFSIRKNVLFECGGFHPDSMPQELIRYRGDGESGLSKKIMEKKLRTVYVPKAMVYHRVPAERLTVEYFCRRAFNQGVSDSYAEIRNKGGRTPAPSLKKSIWAVLNAGKMMIAHITLLAIKLLSRSAAESSDVVLKSRQAYRSGYAFHQKEVLNDPELLDYVLRETYF